MTCRDCRNDLLETLDGTLSVARQDAVRAHLRTCRECTAEVERQAHLQTVLRRELHAATAGLRFDRDAATRAIEQRRRAKPAWLRLLAPSRPRHWLPAFTTSVVAALLVTGVWLHRREGRANATTRFVVDVPYETETHVFRLQNGTIVDAVVSHAAEGRATL